MTKAQIVEEVKKLRKIWEDELEKQLSADDRHALTMATTAHGIYGDMLILLDKLEEIDPRTVVRENAERIIDTFEKWSAEWQYQAAVDQTILDVIEEIEREQSTVNPTD